MNSDGSLVHQESQHKSLHALRKAIDPLLTSKVYPGAVTRSKHNVAGNNMSSYSLPGLDQNRNTVSQDQQAMLMQENEETVNTTQAEPKIKDSKGKNQISMSDTGTILIEKKTVG